MARMLMSQEYQLPDEQNLNPPKSNKFFQKMNGLREGHFNKFREAYRVLLSAVLAHRRFTLIVTGIVATVSLSLILVVGEDFFPSVDAGLIKLHFRAPVGNKLEKTEEMYSHSYGAKVIVDLYINLSSSAVSVKHETSAAISSASANAIPALVKVFSS